MVDERGGAVARLGVSGDEAVFAALYRPLRRFAAVVGAGVDDPDDLVQEALARTLRGSRLTDLDDPVTYLRRVIVNLVANQRRRDRRGRLAVERLAGELATTGQDEIYPSDLADLLRLAPADRAVLFLARVEGRPFGEIAAMTGWSEARLRQRVSRAGRRLRRELTEEGDA